MICHAKDCWCYGSDTPCSEEVLVLDENGRCDRYISEQLKPAEPYEVLQRIARLLDEVFK